MSARLQATEPPYIEDVLDKYSSLPNLTMMALGSSYWGPPAEALQKLTSDMSEREVHRYGNILGCTQLQTQIRQNMASKGFETSGLEIMITAGANQAFTNIALALCDVNDTAVILAPYYFSHKLALQLCGAKVVVCPFEKTNLYPDWVALKEIVSQQRPKMIVLTTPSNPGGLVWGREEIAELIEMCKAVDCWVVVDQVYHEFLHDSADMTLTHMLCCDSMRYLHVYPCNKEFEYEKIVHIFSFSKSFGIPGWRVGYALYPPSLTLSFRKIQDTTVTHASIISQKLASHCLTIDSQHSSENKSLSWVGETVSSLEVVRDALWPVLKTLGTVYTTGAFYFLVPVPPKITEEEAVDILARKYGVLLMPGSPFGAPQHMRLSYGGLPPAAALKAVQQLTDGFRHLNELSTSR